MRGRRILEINPDHPIVKDLNVRCLIYSMYIHWKSASQLLLQNLHWLFDTDISQVYWSRLTSCSIAGCLQE